MLEIMRDSRTGNFGAVTGCLLVLCKYACLVALTGQCLGWALLLIPTWARWAQVLTIGCYPYAREEGMGKIWHDTMAVPADFFAALVVPVVATSLVCMYGGCAAAILVSCAGAVVSGCLTAKFLQGKLQGQTGDTYGAVVEMSEAGGLLFGALTAAWL